MQLPASRLSVPLAGAPTKGGDHGSGYTKRLAGSCIGTESRTGVGTIDAAVLLKKDIDAFLCYIAQGLLQ